MSRPISISLFDSRTDNQPKATTVAGWSEFVQEISEHQRRKPKDGPAWSPAVFRSARRANSEVRDLSLLVLDCDQLQPGDQERICERLDHASLSYVLHSTHSSTPNAPKVRVILDVDRQIQPGELRSLISAIAERFELDVDENAIDPARLFYLPSCAPDHVPFLRSRVGVPLVVDEHMRAIAQGSAGSPSPEVFPAPTSELLSVIRAELAKIAPAIEGTGGDSQTFRVGALLVNDFALSPQQAVEVAGDWNARCVPPWAEDELLRKFENGLRYATGQRGARRKEVEERTPFEREVANALRQLDARARGPSARASSGLVPLSVMLESPAPPVDWLVEGMITKEAVFGIGAEPKSAKTWAALDLALSVASGRPAFGSFRVPSGQPVVLFMLEDDQASVRTRLQALARGRGEAIAEVASKISVQCRGSLDLLDRCEFRKFSPVPFRKFPPVARPGERGRRTGCTAWRSVTARGCCARPVTHRPT